MAWPQLRSRDRALNVGALLPLEFWLPIADLPIGFAGGKRVN
jgi:hypothetical protein